MCIRLKYSNVVDFVHDFLHCSFRKCNVEKISKQRMSRMFHKQNCSHLFPCRRYKERQINTKCFQFCIGVYRKKMCLRPNQSNVVDFPHGFVVDWKKLMAEGCFCRISIFFLISKNKFKRKKTLLTCIKLKLVLYITHNEYKKYDIETKLARIFHNHIC